MISDTPEPGVGHKLGYTPKTRHGSTMNVNKNDSLFKQYTLRRTVVLEICRGNYSKRSNGALSSLYSSELKIGVHVYPIQQYW